MALESGLARLPCHDGDAPRRKPVRRRPPVDRPLDANFKSGLGKTGMVCAGTPIAVDRPLKRPHHRPLNRIAEACL
jgi:hypothetical protein